MSWPSSPRRAAQVSRRSRCHWYGPPECLGGGGTCGPIPPPTRRAQLLRPQRCAYRFIDCVPLTTCCEVRLENLIRSRRRSTALCHRARRRPACQFGQDSNIACSWSQECWLAERRLWQVGKGAVVVRHDEVTSSLALLARFLGSAHSIVKL